MEKTNRKWLYIVAGVLVVAFVAVVAVSNISGEVFQGSTVKSEQEGQGQEQECEDILSHYANIDDSDFTAWMNANNYNTSQVNYCIVTYGSN